MMSSFISPVNATHMIVLSSSSSPPPQMMYETVIISLCKAQALHVEEFLSMSSKRFSGGRFENDYSSARVNNIDRNGPIASLGYKASFFLERLFK